MAKTLKKIRKTKVGKRTVVEVHNNEDVTNAVENDRLEELENNNHNNETRELTTQMAVNTEIVTLKKLEYNNIIKFKDFLERMRRNNYIHERRDFVVPPASWSISAVLQAEGVDKLVADNWNDIPHEEFFKLLVQAVPDEKNLTNIALTEMSMKDRLKDIKFYFNLNDYNMKAVISYIDRVNIVLHQFEHIQLSKEAEKQLLKEILFKTIGDEKNLAPPDQRLREEIQSLVPNTIDEFLIALKKGFKTMVSHLQEADRIQGKRDKNRGGDNNNRDKNRGGEDNNRDKNRGGGDKNRDKNRGHNKQNSDKNRNGGRDDSEKNSHKHTEQPTMVCDVCGRANHGSSDCYMIFHPNANRSSTNWAESYFGKQFAEKTPSIKTLPLRYDVNGNKVTVPPDILEKLAAMDKKSFHGKRKRGEEYLFKCSLQNNNLPLHKGLNIRALLDTGAIESNYISKEVETELIKDGAKRHKCKKLVCSGFKTCTSCLGSYNIFLKFFNEINKVDEIIPIECSVIDTDFDLIIGRKVIKEFSLINKLPSQNLLGVKDSVLWEGRSLSNTTIATPDEFPNPEDGRESVLTEQNENNELLLNVHMSSILSPEVEDIDDLPEIRDSVLPWEVQPQQNMENSEDIIIPKDIQGSDFLKQELIKLCRLYKDIFSRELNPEPALVQPMTLDVDKKLWEGEKRNRCAPRLQSVAKQYEIGRQINKMLANNIIRPSQAAFYSQVLLTPKPDDKWRFCIDYRFLNLVTLSMGWPIPNITLMLQRLGSRKSKYYGLMDLTSGYFQAPLSDASRIYTAFITFMGVFEWLRVPMGLKGAPSYFQQIIATVVLAGLLYIICEVYIDDIIVHGPTELEFLKNIEEVFKRLRKHKITLNPDKCHLGLTQIEFVGHVINEEGIHFSDEKIMRVLNFNRPRIACEMKSFLGLANYFRDHIKNHSIIAQPLQNMIPQYSKRNKSQKLIWDVDTNESFEKLKKAIADCPKLYFINDNAPIHLQTDASNYGHGAYLFQIIEGKEYPIAFISKSFAREQIRWSTPEKEAYAIVFAFRKFEYLIRDTHFTLHTDHANLLYINDGGSRKVLE
jgi:hypothetical protein